MNTFTHPKDAPEGHKLVTTGGQPATQVTCFDVRDDVSIVAVVKGCVHSFTRDGKGAVFDLIDAPVTREIWVNFYLSGHAVHNTRERADYFARRDRIARKRVTFTEGEFDE